MPDPADQLLPVPAAASRLGVSASTLRRYLADGCPVARRGGRGRGRSTLIDTRAVTTWLTHRTAPANADSALVSILACRIPQAMAAGIAELFTGTGSEHGACWRGFGLSPQAAAWLFARLYWQCAFAAKDVLAEHGEVPVTLATPDEIARLEKLATL